LQQALLPVWVCVFSTVVLLLPAVETVGSVGCFDVGWYGGAAAVLVFRRCFGGLGLVVVPDLLSVVVVTDLILYWWWW
jgi:hypothetical protein